MSSSAFIGSCNSVRSLCSRLLPTTPLLEESVPNSNYLSPDFSAFPEKSAAKDHIRSLVPDSLDTIDLTSSSQRDSSTSPGHQAFNNYLRESKFERSCSTKHDICSSRWSMAKGNTQPQYQPCHAQEGVHNRCSHMVGDTFLRPPPSSKRCSCGQVLDSFGDHPLGCGEGTGEIDDTTLLLT